MSTRNPSAPARYRRSPHVLSYWTGAGGVFHNYATGIQARATPLMWRLLDACGDWSDQETLRTSAAPGITEDLLRALLVALVKATFVEVRDGDGESGSDPLERWGRWNPAAGFFHMASRQCSYGDWHEFDEKLREKARSEPVPAAVKPSVSPRVALPLPRGRTSFDAVLAGRHTWRRFGRRPVRREDFAGVLRATLGITHWVRVPGLGELPLTTSPSGGSRHPVEGYVAVMRVGGIAPGIYRYAPDRHDLDVVRPGLSAGEIERLIPKQPWFGQAGFVLFLTAVFERTQWKYDFPRAYRAVLLETGHICQTFLLSATARSLAPFCTMAIDDGRVEALLGLDGVSEAVLYAAGAGTRPPARARVDMPGAGRASVRRHNIARARNASE